MTFVGLVALVIWVGALVDVLLAREFRVLDRWIWVLIVVLGLPPVGALVYLLIGRQRRPVGADHPSRLDPAGRPRGPDDDPDFLRSLG